MKKELKILILIISCFIAIIISISVGSAAIPFEEIIHVLFQTPLAAPIPSTTASILWDIRLPRTFMAFVVGAALATSGAIMQSILRNPLASSYTLGLSSGASLGAAFVFVFGLNIPFLGALTLPLIGFLGGLLSVMLMLSFTLHLDKGISNQTIILVGMAFSLFINALLTAITALSRQHLEQLVFWQMGSLAGSMWLEVLIVFMVLVLGLLYLLRYSKEMDIMSFGEDQALSIGVELKQVKFLLISTCALLTGTTVSFVGIIGFIDLIVPHVVRKLFGSIHHLVLPLSALLGGGFMVVADLISRTILAPSELPIGAVTALIGAPFFIYVFFKKRKGATSSC